MIAKGGPTLVWKQQLPITTRAINSQIQRSGRLNIAGHLLKSGQRNQQSRVPSEPHHPSTRVSATLPEVVDRALCQVVLVDREVGIQLPARTVALSAGDYFDAAVPAASWFLGITSDRREHPDTEAGQSAGLDAVPFYKSLCNRRCSTPGQIEVVFVCALIIRVADDEERARAHFQEGRDLLDLRSGFRLDSGLVGIKLDTV